MTSGVRRRPRRPVAAIGLLIALWCAGPAAAGSALEAARGHHREHGAAILSELVDLLRLPNPARDAPAIAANAERLTAMLEARGVASELLTVDGAPPAVFGRLDIPGATRTVVLYAHYDGQPVEPADWATPPFEPTLRSGRLEDGAPVVEIPSRTDEMGEDWRLYARSASDDKGPIVAMLAALDALRAAEIEPSVNLRFFFEGEEEAGSPHLEALLEKYADRLGADAWIFCDGPVHQSRRGQVVYGVRGVVDLELTVYGPLTSLHSGHYGNWAPNPAARLAELLAALRDGEGRIRVAGFYDDVAPLSDVARAAVAAIPDPDEALREALALGRSEAGNARLAERILLPALNIRGISSGAVGAAAKNAIPTEARASIDFRLVPDQTPEVVKIRVEERLEQLGWVITRDEPDAAARRAEPRLLRAVWGEGYPPLWTPMELPVSRAVARVAREAWGGAVVEIPSLGGSLPLYLFERILDAPLIVLPMVNHDNHQHAANENLRIDNLWHGIELYAHLMATLGDGW